MYRNVLNLGCGDDLKPRMINADILRIRGMTIRCDARYLPFRDKSISFIYMYEMLEHVNDFMRVIDECYRVLRWGAWVTVSFPHIYALRVYLRWFFKHVMSSSPEHIHVFRTEEMRNAFHRFTLIEQWYDTTRWHTLPNIERWLLPSRLLHRSVFMTFRKELQA